MPLRNGGEERGDEIACGHHVEPRGRARPEQHNVVLPHLRQQNRQIVIDARRLDDARTQIAAQPFAELLLAPGRMTPRHHVATHDDGHFERAHVRHAPWRRGHIEQVEHQRAPHRFARRHGDRHQQVDVAARFQPAVERRAEQMHRQQRRAEMPFDRGAHSSHLAGDPDGNDRCIHDARHARNVRRCEAARRHEHDDPAVRTSGSQHRTRITSRRIRAVRCRHRRAICAAQ